MTKKEKLVVLKGNAQPFGATLLEDGVNFSLYSPNIKDLSLHIFGCKDDAIPTHSFRLDSNINKTGDIWHIKIANLKKNALYLFSAKDDLFNEFYILDPYFKLLTPNSIFLSEQLKKKPFQKERLPLNAKGFPKCVVVDDSSFDWQGDEKPNIPSSQCVIYEAHLKGISIKADIPNALRGTYLGLLPLIPHFKKMGITTLELMPIFEFDENEIERKSSSGNDKLKNYWGYSSISFFAPKAGYAKDAKNAVCEFKEMVRALHKEKIEVVLDVVFNHTAECGKVCFKALAEGEYYLLDEKGFHQNYSGCGNTFNTSSQIGRKIIIDSLCYWVEEMHVDGFRFDLASIFMREGSVINTYSKLLQEINACPTLKNVKLIAEPWDAYSSYNLGAFPPKWLEWNDKYRDTLRRFWLQKENAPKAFDVLDALMGSPNIFGQKCRRDKLEDKCDKLEEKKDAFNSHSINFITCHDGFTTADLVSYNNKHNEENMEENRDGSNNNFSFNHEVEGATKDEKIISIRRRQIKNLLFSLFASSGIPMLLMGDEAMRSQSGNNNAYCQDNELSYFDWSLLDENKWLFEYVAKLTFLRNEINIVSLLSENPDRQIEYYNEIGGKMEMNWECSFISIFIKAETTDEKDYFIILNSLEHDVTVALPKGRTFGKWNRLLDTYYTASRNEEIELFAKKSKNIFQSIYISPHKSASIFVSE